MTATCAIDHAAHAFCTTLDGQNVQPVIHVSNERVANFDITKAAGSIATVAIKKQQQGGLFYV
jgi:hypothetical protein